MADIQRRGLEMIYHTRTDAEPWLCECPAYGLRSDNTKGSALDLCRQLVALGVEDGPAIAFRDGKPSMLIRSIHEAAKVTVLENSNDGPRFIPWKPFAGVTVCTPMRQMDQPATLTPPSRNAA